VACSFSKNIQMCQKKFSFFFFSSVSALSLKDSFLTDGGVVCRVVVVGMCTPNNNNQHNCDLMQHNVEMMLRVNKL
jgi:hypothetical protein